MTALTKADDVAATRLLNAAVRKARAMVREGDRVALIGFDPENYAYGYRYSFYDRAAVVAMLTAAGESASLLLDGDES